jgi:oligoendopeptidase F
MTSEIAAVALVDMGVWHWMYEHPEATPAELREATLAIARDVWNRYYAPVIGVRDVTLLAIYSHMIHSYLYLPDYPIGHLIAFQVEAKMRAAGSVGQELERVARIGQVTPDLWMSQAAGSSVTAEPLLEATARALTEVGVPR